MVSDAKSTANLIGETFSFFLASSRVSVFHQFGYDMTMCEMFLCFLLNQIWNALTVFIHIIFLFLSCLFFCDSHYAYAGTLDGVPQVSEALFIFSSFFFLFLKPGNIS